MKPQYRKVGSSEIIYDRDCPYMDIQYESGRMFISSAVFRLIGEPTAIRFHWNPTTCTLVIEPTSTGAPDSVPLIGYTYARHKSFFIGSLTLMHGIWTAIDWDKSLRYRIVAKYNVPNNIAIFELDGAVAFEIPRKGRPRKTKL